MGRERQKAKRRSGTNPVRQKPKKTQKPLLANPLIAEHWDRSQTLSQNYARLGLQSKLNRATGGREIHTLGGAEAVKASEARQNRLTAKAKGKTQHFDVKEARIERDPQTGAILRVVQQEGAGEEGGDEVAGPYKPLNDPLEELDNMVMADASAGNDEEDGPRTVIEVSSSIVKSLEREAAIPSAPKKRKQSDREKAFLQKLIDKYGVDDARGCFDRMSRDPQLNVMQQSPGDLRKRVRRYLKVKGAG